MISLLTKVHIIDNSGGIIGQCIKILKPLRKHAQVGDLILISVKKTIPTGDLKDKVLKGEVHKALVVRTKVSYNKNHHFNSHITFHDNAVVLVKTSPKNLDLTPIASRIKGPIHSSLRYKKGCQKIIALAKILI